MLVFRRRRGYREALRRSDPARAEDEAHLGFVVTGSNTGRRPLVVGARPDENAIEPDFVRRCRPWLEVRDEHERVVVPFDMEGARALAEDATSHGSSRLEPDRRRLGPDVAEKRTDENVGDLGIPAVLLVHDLARQK